MLFNLQSPPVTPWCMFVGLAGIKSGIDHLTHELKSQCSLQSSSIAYSSHHGDNPPAQMGPYRLCRLRCCFYTIRLQLRLPAGRSLNMSSVAPARSIPTLQTHQALHTYSHRPFCPHSYQLARPPSSRAGTRILVLFWFTAWTQAALYPMEIAVPLSLIPSLSALHALRFSHYPQHLEIQQSFRDK